MVRKRRPRPDAMFFELFIPADESGRAKVLKLDINQSSHIDEFHWWSDVYNGRL